MFPIFLFYSGVAKVMSYVMLYIPPCKVVLHSCKLSRKETITGPYYLFCFKYWYVPALRVGSIAAGVLGNGGALAAAASLSFAALIPTLCSFQCCRFLPLLLVGSSEE